MTYGLPYKGSKSRICDWLIYNLPEASTFVDIFFGGGAVTHKALLSGKYKNFIANDLRGTPQFFMDCIKGKYHDEKRWVSREEFFRLKDIDPYIECCWSFGNDWRSYLYGKKIEPYKKACHYAIVFDGWDLLESLCPESCKIIKQALADIINLHERRLIFGKVLFSNLRNMDEMIIQNNPLYKTFRRYLEDPKGIHVSPLENLERIERIQSLESLVRIQSIESLKLLSSDYREIVIPENSVLYCDPPYANSGESYDGFDTKSFLNWCIDTKKAHHNIEIFVSEYSINDERFELVSELSKLVSAAAKCTTKKI